MLSTRARVIAFTPGFAWSARSTVPVEIPSARAMSLMPTGCAGAAGFRASGDMRRTFYPTEGSLTAQPALHIMPPPFMPRMLAAGLAAALFVLQPPTGQAPSTGSGQGGRVAIRVDAAARQAPMRPFWAFFGYDEPNYTYMKDGRKLLSEL